MLATTTSSALAQTAGVELPPDTHICTSGPGGSILCPGDRVDDVEQFAASTALGFGGWGGYEGSPVNAGGTFRIAPDGREIYGTMPPGYSITRLKDEPGLESVRAAIAAGADTSRLLPYLRDGGTAGTVAAAQQTAAEARDEAHNGCVSAFSYIQRDGIRYKGQMAGCRRGRLWLHTYLNANGRRIQDGLYNECANSTECSVPYEYYGGYPGCRVFTNYAHGINRTTGGEDYAWEEHRPQRHGC